AEGEYMRQTGEGGALTVLECAQRPAREAIGMHMMFARERPGVIAIEIMLEAIVGDGRQIEGTGVKHVIDAQSQRLLGDLSGEQPAARQAAVDLLAGQRPAAAGQKIRCSDP